MEMEGGTPDGEEQFRECVDCVKSIPLDQTDGKKYLTIIADHSNRRNYHSPKHLLRKNEGKLTWRMLRTSV